MIKRNIFIILVMLAVTASMTLNVWAIDEGSYVVSNNTHYVNPDTEKSDDGGDVSTGEGMCRNTVYPQSLYEYKDGKHFVTLRIKMISFIKNVRISVQTEKGNENSYKSVEYTVSGQNIEENTRDFRFEIPSADVLINPSFFVGPMNRDVTFFVSINVDTAKADEGEFNSFNDNESKEEGSTEAEKDNTSEKEKSISTMAVDDENDSTEAVSEPSNDVQPIHQDIVEKENSASEENKHDNEDNTESSSALNGDEKDSSYDNESISTNVEEENVSDGIEETVETVSDDNINQAIDNDDKTDSLSEAKDEETAGIVEYDEKGNKMVSENEEDSSTSSNPVIITVVVVVIIVLLIYLKRKLR